MEHMGDTLETQEAAFDVRRLLMLGLGFGCLFGATGAAMFGAGGYFGPVSSFGDVSTPAAMCLRLGAIALIAVLGLAGRHAVRMPLVIGAAVAAAAGGIGVSLVPSVTLSIAAGALEGAGEGVLLYAWFMLLSSRHREEIVFATLIGFLVAWASFVAAPHLDRTMQAALYAVLTFVSAFAFLHEDASCASCAPDGGFDRSQIARVPWFSVCVTILCTMLASALFGTVSIVFPATNGSLTYALFATTTLADIMITYMLMTLAKDWTQSVWIPTLVMLFIALLFSCFMTTDAIRLAVALMMATMFGYFFLRWPVFAGMLSDLRLPRSFAAGIVLVLTNGFFMYRLGESVGRSLPESVFNVNGVAGVMTLLVVVSFGIAAGLARILSTKGGIAAAFSGSADTDAEEASAGEPADPVAAFAETLESHFDDLSAQFGLTPREREIAMLTAQGFTSTYIADKLVISASTVRFHQQNVYRKLDIHSRHELIELANADLIAASRNA